MELKDVVSVTGMPGLHKILGRNKSGLILESLTDNKRFGTNPRQRISVLSDIAMFTDDEEVKLAVVLMSIKALEDAGTAIPDAKADNDEVKAFMAKVLPNYDRERVYTSDMKKLFVWYGMLKGTDLDWSNLDKVTESEEGTDTDAPKATDSKAKKSAAAPKNTAIKKPAAGAKTKTTTPRKMGS
ncbi:MAG: DUF5606 domain-containing protein [Bacteroidota bacterium]|jgi:hypothetical protein